MYEMFTNHDIQSYSLETFKIMIAGSQCFMLRRKVSMMVHFALYFIHHFPQNSLAIDKKVYTTQSDRTLFHFGYTEMYPLFGYCFQFKWKLFPLFGYCIQLFSSCFQKNWILFPKKWKHFMKEGVSKMD